MGGDILHGNNVANLTREKRTIFKLEWGKKKHVVFFSFLPFQSHLFFGLQPSCCNTYKLKRGVFFSGLNATSDKSLGGWDFVYH